MKPLVTQERLRSLLHYSPETGVFTRLANTHARCNTKPGEVVGVRGIRGELHTTIDHRYYKLHRLAWFYMTGQWPKHEIDHVDGDPGNNAWYNLRDVPRQVNQQNIRVRKANRKNDLPMGVTIASGNITNRYVAQIGLNRKTYHLGYFKTAAEAHEAYLSAKRRMHEGCTI